MKASLIVILLALAACATVENFDAMVKTWIGHNEQELYDSRGYPAQILEKDEKTKVVAYHRSQKNYIATQNFGLVENEIKCSVWFDVDKASKIITSVIYKGNGCKAY